MGGSGRANPRGAGVDRPRLAPGGWTIEAIRTDGKWQTLLWKGRHIHGRFKRPLDAARAHAELVKPGGRDDKSSP
ncbi:hypothetical protein CG017_05792 (plasmid) [Burkholderia glumae]|nr:hypothetical protein CG017_05792 [Burkholderia glumae]